MFVMSMMLYVCHVYAAVCLICIRWCMFAMSTLLYVCHVYAAVYMLNADVVVLPVDDYDKLCKHTSIAMGSCMKMV